MKRNQVLSFIIAITLAFTSIDLPVYAAEFADETEVVTSTQNENDVTDENTTGEAGQDETTTVTETESQTESQTEPVTKPVTESETEPEAEPEADPKTEAESEVKSEEELNLLREEVVDEELLKSEEDEEEQIIGFKPVDTIYTEFKPALYSLKEEFPESITAITNKDNEIKLDVSDWVPVDDYNLWIGTYRFECIYDEKDYIFAEDIEKPILTVKVGRETMPTLGYLEYEKDEEVPVVERDTKGLLRGSSLPSYYSNKDNLPTVRNQSPYGTCWAHANIGAVEADLIKNDGQNKNTLNLSELQLAYYCSHTYDDPKDCHDNVTRDASGNPTYLDHGGNDYMARNSFLNMVGVVKESDVPYKWGDTAILDEKYAVSSNYAQVFNSYNINRTDIDSIKEAVMKHGGVTTSIFAPSTIEISYIGGDDENEEHETAYYNSVNNCLYGNIKKSNHAVLIVGWDDNFSKDKFDSKLQPEHDGAWLVRNSWGLNSWGYYGYFWVSYENGTFYDGRVNTAYDVSTKGMYDYVYSYDSSLNYADYTNTHGLAKGSPLTYSVDYDVFANESVEAVLVKTVNTNGKIKVSVSDGIYTSTGEKDFITAGAYNIKLDNPIKVEKATNIVVTVTIIPPADQKAAVCEEYGDKVERGYYINGEKKTWHDAGVKLFTNKITSSGSQTTNTIGVKESFIEDHWKSTHQIELASNSVVTDASLLTWTSNNTDIATVNENGLVTIGAKKGIATVTGTYKKGSTTYIATVNVKVKPYTITYDWSWSDDYSHEVPKEYYPGDPENCRLLTADDVAKEGHVLEGWYREYNYPDYAQPVTDSDLVCLEEDITIYAKWSDRPLRVYYYAPNAGLNGFNENEKILIFEATSQGSIPTLYGETNDPNNFSLSLGKKFSYWSVDPEGNEKKEFLNEADFEFVYSAGKYIPVNNEIYVYPQYEDIGKIKVTFDVKGADSEVAPIEVDYNGAYGTLPVPSKVGYSFVNWHLNSSSGDIVTADSTVIYLYEHKLVAEWEANEYTITFDAQGGTCSVATWPVTYGKYYGYSTSAYLFPKPTRDGYKFKWWSTEPEGYTIVDYYDAVTIPDNHTLYAIWQADNQIEVSFYDSDAKKVVGGGIYTVGEPYGAFFDYKKQGYSTESWIVESTGKTVTESDEVLALEEGESKRVILWKGTLKKYKTTVHFNSMGGTPCDDVVFNWDVKNFPRFYRSYPYPTRKGFGFESWYEDENCAINKVSYESMVIPKQFDYEDTDIEMTLYAKWIDLGLPPAVANPVAKYKGEALPASSNLISGEQITFETATEGADIHVLRLYAPNIENPNKYYKTNGFKYTEPIVLENRFTTVYYYAYAVKDGYTDSDIVCYAISLHSHSYRETVISKASFEHPGTVRLECSYCDEVKDNEVIPQLDKIQIGTETKNPLTGEVEFTEKTSWDYPLTEDSLHVRVIDVEGKVISSTQYTEKVYYGGPLDSAEDLREVTKDDEFVPGYYRVVVTMGVQSPIHWDPYWDPFSNKSYYEGEASAQFTISAVEEKVEPVTWEFLDEEVTATVTGDNLIRYVPDGTKIKLSTETSGATIYYSVSDGTSDAATITNIDNLTSLNKYTEPITLDLDKAVYSNGIYKVTLNAVAVKGREKSDVLQLEARMNGPDDDWGNVIQGMDINVTKSSDIPKGLWISDYTIYECMGDKGTFTPSLEYSGYAKQIMYYQRVFYNNKLLNPLTDYTIKYTNNVRAWTQAGASLGLYAANKAPTITITGKGLYTGSFTRAFEITPIDLTGLTESTERKLVIKSSLSDKVAENNKAPKPKYTITLSVFDNVKNKTINKTLRENTDYTVDYSYVKSAPGTYPIFITPKGDYRGSINTQNITVVSPELLIQNATVKVDASKVNPDGTDQTHNVKVTVKVKDKNLIEGTDYDLEYEYTTLPDVDNGKVISAGKYIVHVKGKGAYTGEKSQKFDVRGGIAISNGRLVTLKNFMASVQYGQKQDVSLANLSTGEPLLENRDYVIIYTNADVVGRATMTIYGIGAYSGALKKTYTISGFKFNKNHITLTNSEFEFNYNPVFAEDTVPVVKVPDPANAENEITLVEGEDYYLDQPANQNLFDAGTYKFYVVGKGRYAGSKVEQKYKVLPFDIEKDQKAFKEEGIYAAKIFFVYNMEEETEEYTGVGEIPQIYQNFLRTEPVEMSEYDIKNYFTFKYNTKTFLPGSTVEITVTGKKNFKGVTKVYYKVGKKDIEHATVDLVDFVAANKSNTQNPLRKAPALTIKNGNKRLSINKDYKVEYLYNNSTIIYKNINKEEPQKRYRNGAVIKTDYIVGDNNGTEILVRITGIGNYSGTKECTYRVMNPTSDINKAIVTINPIDYDGKTVLLSPSDVVVKYGKAADAPVLMQGRDYEITGYKNNNKVGKATVILHGIGMYAGVKNVAFTINKKTMNYCVALRYDVTAIGEPGKNLTVTGKTPVLNSPKSNEFTLPNQNASKLVAKYVVYKLDNKGRSVVDTKNTITYKLEGWYDDQGNRVGGPGEKWVATIAGRNINPGEKAVLTAKFIKPVENTKVCTVNFKPGFTTTVTMRPQVLKQGVPTTLSNNGFRRNGYTFSHWQVEGGTATYENKKPMYYTGGESEPTTLNLVAQWTPIDYKIDYDLAGGKWVNGYEPDSSFNCADSGTTELPSSDKIIRTGYVFGGWKLNKDIVTGISNSNIGNKKVIAQWNPLTYTVTFDVNLPTGVTLKDGISGPTTLTSNVGKAIVIPSTKPADSEGNYTFLGWSPDANPVNAKYKSGSVSFTTNTKLYGVWQAKEYTITYNPGVGGVIVGDAAYSKTYTYNHFMEATLPKATMSGKKFNGWKLGEDLLTTETLADFASLNDLKVNVTLIADWQDDEDKKIIVHYAPGVVSKDYMDNQVITLPVEGTPPVFNANTFDRGEGYSFAGWKSLTGEIYADGAAVPTEIPAGKNVNHIYLVAQWRIWKRTISFNMNPVAGKDFSHVTGVPEDIELSYGESIDFTDSALQPTITGSFVMEFVGWALSPDGDVLVDSGSIQPDKLNADIITLYAIWE